MQPAPATTYPDPGFWTRTSLMQLGYGVWVNLSMAVIGLAFGFTAVAMPQIAASDIKTNTSDRSWIASVLTLSAPLGNLISGILIDKLGRRVMLVLSHVPVSFGWLYTGVASTAADLIIGRVITGFGMGMVMSVPRPYLTEISLPNMRGVIGSFPNLAMAMGITVQAGLGVFCGWQTLCYICMSYSLALMCFNYFLPETPYYLLMNDTVESAEAALRKFRSPSHNIQAEMDELIDFKMENDIHRLTWKEKFYAVFIRSSCKPFLTMFIYNTLAQMSGVYIIIMWTVEILEHSQSSIDPHTGNVLLGVTRLISGIFTSIIIFKVGRKPLALTSGLGVGVICITLGFFVRYTDQRTPLPQVFYMGYIMFATLGHYTLPVLIMYELYPLQIRGFLGGISISIMNVSVFLMNKIYPSVSEALGFTNTLLMFGLSSLLCSLFLYFYLPETKDLTLQEIEEYYNDRRSTLTSQRRIMSMHALNKSAPGKSNTASKSLIRIMDRHKKGKHDRRKSSDRSERDDRGSTSKDAEKHENENGAVVNKEK